jgi:hypothetical protein
MGTNAPDRFECEYRKLGYDQGLFSQQQMHTLKAEIRDHTNESKTRRSAFISFSASLLTTLQRAVWHKEKSTQTYTPLSSTHLFLVNKMLTCQLQYFLVRSTSLKSVNTSTSTARRNTWCGSRSSLAHNTFVLTSWSGRRCTSSYQS